MKKTGAGLLLGLLTAAYTLDYLDRVILSITLNQIGREFALSDVQLGTLSGLAFGLVYAVFGFALAGLAVPGRRKALVTGTLFVWSALTAATAFAGSYLHLLAARVGVGIGEAGYVPSAHSMISDAVPRERRPAALAFFHSGSNAGIFLAFLFGGYVSATWGWRAAFLIAGLPGLALALVMALRLREPPTPRTPRPRGYLRLARELLGDPVARHVLIGSVLVAMTAHGALAWIAAFIVRGHGLPLAYVGLYLALAVGLGGAVGTILGGRLAARAEAARVGGGLLVVMLTILIARPLSMAGYLVPAPAFSLALLVVPAVLGNIYTGPVFSRIYDCVPVERRPLATAVLMFALNFVGLALGPIFVGAVSDTVRVIAPEAPGLGIGLAALQVFSLWGALHFWLAARKLRA